MNIQKEEHFKNVKNTQETSYQKLKQEEHRKAVRDETMKSVMADHVWMKTGSHQPLWNEVKYCTKNKTTELDV